MYNGYAPPRKTNLFDPKSREPFRLSRSRLDRFLECPRCFYLDRRLGVDRPGTPPFSLNNAVDTLMKKEFDIHRAARTAHPLMKAYGIDAVPFAHEKLNDWRDSLRKGVEYLHPETNLKITGGVDDVWINQQEELHVVDYKATSKDGDVGIDAEWQGAYKRQLEVYQWLLRKNGFHVSDTGYFVYCNGNADKKAFDGKLEFDVTILPYVGNDAWVDAAVRDAKMCLMRDTMPEPHPACSYCRYRAAAASVGAA